MKATEPSLRPCLSVFDLTFLGIGAIIGAGIFILTGIVAAVEAGPGVIFSFIVAAFASACTALAYAELAASIGGCGSAYTYAYAGFGSFIGWIVGWDLMLEYGVIVSTVAVGWSEYCRDLILRLHVHIPYILSNHSFKYVHINVFSALITLVLSILLMLGVKSSARVNNMIVLLKLAVLILFLIIATKEVNPQNWVPFLPFGWGGVVRGASLVFFAYIGFDAVSTAAEEIANPQRDLPRAIIVSLVICTILYILVAFVLTGVVPYQQLNVASPISYALALLGYKMAAGIVDIGAIAGLTTVMLVMYYGLSRVFLAMARDGFLPEYFTKIHPITQTPLRIIGFCGFLITIIATIIPMPILVGMVNIGTLFAFIIVCGGAIFLRYSKPDMVRPFKVPLLPYIPILGILSCADLICNLAWMTILRVVIWFLIGLIVYYKFYRSRA